MGTIFNGFAQEEIQVISELKRFEERFSGDPGFRQLAYESPGRRAELLSNIGITNCQLQECDPLWQHLDMNNPYLLKPEDVADYPELEVFMRWKAYFARYLSGLDEIYYASSKHQQFYDWQQRQIQRFKSQTAIKRSNVVFPYFCYELSKGCSVGCWFCGLSAERFQGYVSYNDENAQLWREILDASLDFVGDAARYSFCYHATEPFDNPDYLKFIEDYGNLYDFYPQTTTAIPLKKLSMTRKMMALRNNNPIITDRFSVLTLSQLDRIHQTFSAYELRNTELVLQNEGSLVIKSGSGRALAHPERLEEGNHTAQSYQQEGNILDPSTIDCVCGFLVNMVDRRIRLTSPCLASEHNPNGYRTHAEGTFQTVNEYSDFLEYALREHTQKAPAWEETLSFRPDLAFQPTENGFNLVSRAYRHEVKGEYWYPILGEMINQGRSTQREIVTQLGIKGISILPVKAIIGQLFEKSFLRDSLTKWQDQKTT